MFGPPRQILCDEAPEFTSHIVQAILYMLNCKLKVISPYNHGSSRDKGQMWPLFMTTLLNKSAIESPDNKFADITLKDGSKGLIYSPCTLMDYASIYGKV